MHGGRDARRRDDPGTAGTGIRKQIALQLAHDRAAVTVTHRLENLGPWGVELALRGDHSAPAGRRGDPCRPGTHFLDGAGLLPN